MPELRLTGVSLYDWPVLEFGEIPGWNPEPVTIGGKTWPILGILGIDVLLREPLYLSLARQEMGWTENPPFRGTQSWELVPTAEPLPVYRLRDTFGSGEESLFLVDTGAVADQMDPDNLAEPARQDAHHWLKIVTGEGTSVAGLWTGQAPLRAGQTRHVSGIPQLTGVGYQILGTETLSATIPHSVLFP